jgi:hypothetical protein
MQRGTEGGQALARARLQRVPDPRPAPLAADDAGLAQHAKVMGDRRLGKARRRHHVAGADGAVRRELAHDRQPRRIRQGAEEPDVGIVRLRHAAILSTNFYIDNSRYMT